MGRDESEYEWESEEPFVKLRGSRRQGSGVLERERPPAGTEPRVWVPAALRAEPGTSIKSIVAETVFVVLLLVCSSNC